MNGLHFVRVQQPHGVDRWYIYAWRGGPLVTRRSSVRKPSFTPRELRNIERSVRELKSPDPDTLASLISDWRWGRVEVQPQTDWSSLPPGTKRLWARALDEIADSWGGSKLSSWDDASRFVEIRDWRDRCRGIREGNAKLSALRALLQYGLSSGRLAYNVAMEIDLLQPRAPRELRIWTERDMERFASAALRRGKLHVLDGMRLALLTGLKRQDLVELCWADIAASPSKHPTLALVRSIKPADDALDSLLSELRRRYRAEAVQNLLVDARGEPWTTVRFTHAFNRIRDAAGIGPGADQALTQKHLHDLRTTFCVNLLCMTKASDPAIASSMGWRPAKVASVRDALNSQKLQTSETKGQGL